MSTHGQRDKLDVCISPEPSRWRLIAFLCLTFYSNCATFVQQSNLSSLFCSEKEYANLCALCEHPSVCDYPDTFSGYDGALRCLSDNGGQVAWSKVYFVKKHFGVSYAGNT